MASPTCSTMAADIGQRLVATIPRMTEAVLNACFARGCPFVPPGCAPERTGRCGTQPDWTRASSGGEISRHLRNRESSAT